MLYGKSQDTAKQLLEAAGFIIGTISEEYSDSVAEGNVISTDPQANVELEKGSIVNMVVSKGKEIIMLRILFLQVILTPGNKVSYNP